MNWPPKINYNIDVYDINNEIIKFTGKVVQNIWNNTASVIKLNIEQNYIDKSLKQFPQFSNGINHYLLTASRKWQYTKDINNEQSESNNIYVNIIPNIDTNLYTTDIDKTNEINKNKLDANNPYYKPLISNSSIEFSEEDNDILNSNIGISNITSIDSSKQLELLNKLKQFEKITKNNIVTPMNYTITNTIIIKDAKDEINEGHKMINYIKSLLNFTDDLLMKIHAGYVIVTRKGASILDVITNDLVPNIQYFKWQLNEPINYHSLKHFLLQSETELAINVNKEQKTEAEYILGQEHVIAIQIKSKFQMWCIERLLMIWYGDKEIEQCIRKIKLLINHYRADSTQNYNIKYGVLPMVMIFPRYGIENAKLLLSKLEYYFSLYVNDDIYDNTSIYIANSQPTYYIKKNNLIYYANGSTDLKQYINEIIKNEPSIIQKSFNQEFTKFIINK